MTAAEFQTVMSELGVSNRQMADRLGMNRSSVNAYAAGKAEIPHYVALACAALLAGIPAYGTPPEDK